MRNPFLRWIRSFRKSTQAARGRRRPYRPNIEGLEQRWVMSTTASVQQLLTDPVNGQIWRIGPFGINAQTGNVTDSNPLDFRQSEINRTLQAWNSPGGPPALVYNSETTDSGTSVTGVLGLSLTVDSGYAATDIKVTVNGGSTQDFPVSSHTTGVNYFLPVPVADAAAGTGVFDWTVGISAVIENTSSHATTTYSDSTDVWAQQVVTSSGPFSGLGDGWGIAGLDRVTAVVDNGQNDVLMVYGTGASSLFTNPTGSTTITYTSPGYDFGTLTKNNSTGDFTYTAVDQTKWLFNSSGQLTEVVDPNNLTRVFSYLTDGKISTIQEPGGGTATFSYSGGLTGILEPSGTVGVTISSGDLTSILNPDGVTHTFDYSSHALVTDSWGNQIDEVGWNNGLPSMVNLTDTSGDSSTWNIVPIAGLAPVGSPSPIDSPAESTLTDPLSRTTTQVLDMMGRLTLQYTPDTYQQSWSLNSNGLLTVAVDSGGRSTTFSYDGSGNVTEVQFTGGTNEQFQYDGTFNKLTQIQDQLGKKTTLHYDGAGNLATITNALNQVTTYSWSGGLLTSVIDPLGHTTEYSYLTGTWRLHTIQDAQGNKTTFAYSNAAGDPASVTNALGVMTFTYDGMRRVLTEANAVEVQTFTYEPQGWLDTMQAPLGRLTTYTYNNLGEVKTVQEPLSYKTTNLYDAAGNLTEAFDARNYATQYQYDEMNRVTQTTDAGGGVWTTRYDALGNVTEVKNADGYATTYQYDALERVTGIANVSLSYHTTIVYDARGSVTEVIDPRGNATQYEYDALGRQTVMIDAAGNHTTSVYDADANVTEVIDSRGNATQYQYDSLNRLTVTIDALGNRTSALYDAVGDVTQVTDGNGNSTHYQYDAVGRQTGVVDALGKHTTLFYDALGNLTQVTDANGNSTQYQYDALGRQTVTIDGNGYDTTTLYDLTGHVTQVTDADNNITTFVYDGLGRETEMVDVTNGGAHTETYAYDAVSNLTSTTNRNGQVQHYYYDALNRLTLSTYTVSGSTVSLTFTYDGDGNLLTAANNNGTYTMTYDLLNRVTAVQEPFGQSLTVAYDQLTNRAEVQDSKGGDTNYYFDAANNLIGVLCPVAGTGNTLLATFEYTGTNQVSSIGRYNVASGVSDIWDVEAVINGTSTASFTQIGSTSLTYDADNRVTALVHYDPSHNAITTYAETYDPAGNLSSETRDGTSTNFTYDGDNQLVGSGTWTYSYDANGNRNSTGYAKQAGNEITNDGVWTYTYDNEGNVTGKSNSSATWTYTYDTLNHMIAASESASGGGTIQETLKYDAFGNRIEEDVSINGGGATVTRFAYDGWNTKVDAFGQQQTYVGTENWHVWADLDGSNHLITRYIYGNGIDQIIARVDASNNVSWYLADRQGSVIGLVDGSGWPQDALHYDPFGGLVTETNPSYGDRYKYNAMQFDSYSGLYNDRARWYDPNAGRWTTQDPIGFHAGDPNLYRYVYNSPTNATDPSGEFWWLIGAAIGAVLGGIKGGWKGALIGGLAGGIGSLTGGLAGGLTSQLLGGGVGAGIAGGTVGGVVGGVAGTATQQLLTTGTLEGKGLLAGGILGGVTGGLTGLLGGVGGMLPPPGGSLALVGGGQVALVPALAVSINGTVAGLVGGGSAALMTDGSGGGGGQTNPAQGDPLTAMGRPNWANNPGGFVNWLKNLQQNGTILTPAQADAIIAEGQRLGIYIRQDPPHPGTPWDVPHLNIGDSANVHLEIPSGYVNPNVPTGSAARPRP